MNYSKVFQQYAKALKSDKYSSLTVVEEKRLLEEYRNGSQVAFTKLVNAYLRFVIHIVKEFKIPTDMEIMDIIQEGNLGFMIGLSKFDAVNYDCRVSTYCVFWIKFFIKKALSINSKLHDVFYNLAENEDIAEKVIGEDVIEQNLKEKIYEDINKYILTRLTLREQFIIKSYYGLEYPFRQKTLQEIASICHINCERVRQLRNTALEKINKQTISNFVHTI